MIGQSVSLVDEPDFGRILKRELAIFRQVIAHILFKLAEIVEKDAVSELRGTVGALMYEG